ncbi:MAG: hypothetical protein R2856_06980 [Caldilineaceae bacterium]
MQQLFQRGEELLHVWRFLQTCGDAGTLALLLIGTCLLFGKEHDRRETAAAFGGG